jgi:Glycosyltransferase family 87/WD40-like Beta Propeller Repeat
MPTRSRNLEYCEWALAAALFAWFGFTTFPHAWGALNSDFSNYYITAHMVRDHTATSRIYEWIWFQRQKDHLGVNLTFSAMPPLTPFSTLFLWPVTKLAPLTAKHYWLALNGGLLLSIAWMLRRTVDLRWSRIALFIAASYPLERNLLNGQYYILLLFFLTLGLWLHVRGHRFAAGTSIAVAVGLKMFPLLYVLYFLRKRDWRALAGSIAGGLAVAAISLAAFGWQLHRLYFEQVLPRSMRGESTGPYNLTSASFTVLFHRLFIYEPALNPHPALHAAWLFPVMLSIVQLLVVVPLILLVDPHKTDSRQIQFEWSACLLACLTLSPLPASYHFVLLFLPIAVLLKSFIDESAWGKLTVLVLLYLAIGYPAWHTISGDGWLPLLHVPRLYATIGLYALSLVQLRPRSDRLRSLAAGNLPWLAALTSLTAIGIGFALYYQRNVDSEYAGQLSIPAEQALLAEPLATGGGLSFIAMERRGYRAIDEGQLPDLSIATDELSHAELGPRRWVERASTTSQIVSNDSTIPPIDNAEQPILSLDGRWLAFTREDHGRAALWLHALENSQPDDPATPPDLDVLEASFAPGGSIVFAALQPAGTAALFERNADGNLTQISGANEEARYPAVSPDGKWLVYSQLNHGSWNLRLRDRGTGRTTALTDASCNAVDPSWGSDSHTLLFASDCGRAIGLTALYRRRVVP